MNVRILKWEDPLRILFKRKYKNTKRPNIFLRENSILKFEIKNNKGLYYDKDIIDIEEYDNVIKRWFWQRIKREK